MSSIPLENIRDARLTKIASLRALGLNPYRSTSARTHYIAPLIGEFEKHENARVTVAGRLMSWRKQGSVSFGHIQDQTGTIQLLLKRQSVAPTDAATGTLGYAEINLLDVGDIVEGTGTVGKSQRGEISIMVESFRILTKSVRPLPDQWAGMKDRELILRKRYLDTILEPDSKRRFAEVAGIIQAVRVFLIDRGFLEFPTPNIQPQYGGGTAKPFLTHVNALSCDMYLSIAHELYLKRLIVAGYDKVYTIGRCFRNEGIDRSHHPEFSLVETMTAYENYEYNMDLIEDMFRFVATKVFGRTQFKVQDHIVDFAPAWRRVSMCDAVLQETGRDFRNCASLEEAHAWMAELGVREAAPSIGEALAAVFSHKVEATLIQPTLVFGHPIEISPLAKPMPLDPRYVERFEIFISGMECGDNWSEQNDPVQLLETWRKAFRPEDRDSGEFHPLDFDFVEAMEYGMPPTTGIGPGIERMAMIFTEHENIDDVIFSPLMRPLISPVNRIIYNVPEVVEAEKPAALPDVVLSVEDFQSLMSEGKLAPSPSGVAVKPTVKIWTPATEGDPWRATGSVEISGLLAGQSVVVSGYRKTSSEPLEHGPETKKLIAAARQSIRSRYPDCQIGVTDVAAPAS
jgi:lysyl-tRNA synthetase class 2